MQSDTRGGETWELRRRWTSEMEKEGEKKERETGRSLRAQSDGPTAVLREARNYAARPLRKRGVKIALRSSFSLSFSQPSRFSHGLVWSLGPAAIIEIDILLMARTIIHGSFIELFPDNYESITII